MGKHSRSNPPGYKPKVVAKGRNLSPPGIGTGHTAPITPQSPGLLGSMWAAFLHGRSNQNTAVATRRPKRKP